MVLESSLNNKIGYCDLCDKDIMKEDKIEKTLLKLFHRDCYYDDMELSYAQESYHSGEISY